MVRQKHKLISWSVLIFRRANSFQKVVGTSLMWSYVLEVIGSPLIRIGLSYIHNFGGTSPPPPPLLFPFLPARLIII